jgi:hypothetical protein
MSKPSLDNDSAKQDGGVSQKPMVSQDKPATEKLEFVEGIGDVNRQGHYVQVNPSLATKIAANVDDFMVGFYYPNYPRI